MHDRRPNCKGGVTAGRVNLDRVQRHWIGYRRHPDDNAYKLIQSHHHGGVGCLPVSVAWWRIATSDFGSFLNFSGLAVAIGRLCVCDCLCLRAIIFELLGKYVLYIAIQAASHNISTLECGPMPNVMAAQPNIGGAVCESSVIPFLVPRRKVWLTPAAGVPCNNAANTGERRTWT